MSKNEIKQKISTTFSFHLPTLGAIYWHEYELSWLS